MSSSATATGSSATDSRAAKPHGFLKESQITEARLQQIRQRLDRAIYELGHATSFNRWIRNDDLEQAIGAVVKAVEQSSDKVRDQHDFAWLKGYLSSLQTEKQRLYDESH